MFFNPIEDHVDDDKHQSSWAHATKTAQSQTKGTAAEQEPYLSHEGDVLFHNGGRDGGRTILQAAVLVINAASVDRVEVDLLTVTGYEQ